MHSWTTVKLTCCIVIIWTTLIVDYSSCADVDNRISYNKNSPPPSTSTTEKMIKAQGEQSSQSMQSKERSSQSAADPNKPGNNSNQKIQPSNGRVELVAGLNHLSGKAESLRQPTTVEVRTEESSTFRSVWIYITVGILCVAAFNVYMFWYRKRTTTYSFTPPPATTSRARR